MIKNFDQEKEKLYHPENFQNSDVAIEQWSNEELMRAIEIDHDHDESCDVCYEAVRRGLMPSGEEKEDKDNGDYPLIASNLTK